MEGVTGCCRGVSQEVLVAGEVSREVSGGCGGGCDEVLPRCVTGGVGCVWGRCVMRGVGVHKGVGFNYHVDSVNLLLKQVGHFY